MLLRSTPDRRPLAAHIWAKEEHGFYIEPQWCSERLFEVEKFNGAISHPAGGIGRVAEAARCAAQPTSSIAATRASMPALTFSAASLLAPRTSSAIHRSISAISSFGALFT